MDLRYPWYYPQFQCIAGSCSDSCCIGWEIEIDPESYDRFQSYDGSFGDRLRKGITKTEDSTPCFRRHANGRCYFLNEENLCNLILAQGEDILCQICTDHPRFYHWLSDGREAGLGLCCEAAAALILQPAPESYFITEKKESDPIDTDSETAELEDFLLQCREELFQRIAQSDSFDAACNALFSACEAMQTAFEALLFGMEPSEESAEPVDYMHIFWQTDSLQILLKLCSSLEQRSAKWMPWLKMLFAKIDSLPKLRSAFLAAVPEAAEQYRSLLYYFLYRHFLDTAEYDSVYPAVIFAIHATGLIQLLDIAVWQQEGTFSLEKQIEICKCFSQEIEYNEENTIAFSELDLLA